MINFSIYVSDKHLSPFISGQLPEAVRGAVQSDRPPRDSPAWTGKDAKYYCINLALKFVALIGQFEIEFKIRYLISVIKMK